MLPVVFDAHASLCVCACVRMSLDSLEFRGFLCLPDHPDLPVDRERVFLKSIGKKKKNPLLLTLLFIIIYYLLCSLGVLLQIA